MTGSVNTSSARMGLVTMVLGSLVLIVGCGHDGPTRPTILQARSQPYVADLPVPVDFNLDRRQSDHTITAGERHIKHVYVGTASPLVVRNFYIHEMPGNAWELKDEKLQNNVYLLNFHKGNERCEIRIERSPGKLIGAKTEIRATVKE